MYKWERDKVVKNQKFARWNTITVDKWKDTLEMLILSTKKIMNYLILTITWNKKEENEKLKSIRLVE